MARSLHHAYSPVVTETPTPPVKLCPKGHPVRTRYGRRQCSQMRCGEDAQAEAGSQDIDLDALAKTDPKESEFQSRLQLAKVPKGLTGDAAVKWSQEKMVDLLPEAVANLAHDLRYGNEKARAAATEKVLAANGLDKKDAGAQGQHGLIILQLGTDSAKQENIPWLQRLSKPKGESK